MVKEQIDGRPATGRTPRYELRLPFPILVQSSGQWHSGRLRNLSTGGAFITLDRDLWIGEELAVVLRLPERAGGNLELRALTVWRDEKRRRKESSKVRGYGILFLTQLEGTEGLPETLRRLLETDMTEPDRSSSSPPGGRSG